MSEEDLLEDATAVRGYIAFLVAQRMEEAEVSKAEMARRMRTGRSALDRLLDQSNESVTLLTLQSAAQALGGRLKIDFEFQNDAVSVGLRHGPGTGGELLCSASQYAAADYLLPPAFAVANARCDR